MRRALSILLVSVLGGCALGEDGVNRRDTDARVATLDAGRDAGAASDAWIPPIECEPRCADTETCVDGTCVSGVLDLDGDGVPAASDCDDMNASVTSSTERACTNACGAGVERCTDGAWAACDAPASCECAAGSAPRTVDCAQCGTQQQSCVDGMWTNTGSCTGMGACSPGATETGTQSCGTCGGGTQTRTRSCGADCSWGAWGGFGTCTGDGGECTPGERQDESRACGNCDLGTQARSRTCGSGCTWGSWGSYGTCTGGGACAPGATRAGCDRNSVGTPTTCGVERCTSSCTWGTTCELAPGAACMSGSGSNHSCCTPAGGGAGWRFCNASTCQWYDCAPHSC